MNINWNKLQNAYGYSESIPQLLSDLDNFDESVCNHALFELQNKICHQSANIYEVTSYTLPFLINIIQNQNSPCHAQIIELLGDIARVVNVVHSSPQYRSAINDILISNLDVFIKELSSDNPGHVICSMYLLASLLHKNRKYVTRTQHTFHVLQILKRELSKVQIPLVKAANLIAIFEIWENDDDLKQLLEEYFYTKQDIEIKIVCAILLATQCKVVSDDKVIDRLTDYIINYGDLRAILSNSTLYPWRDMEEGYKISDNNLALQQHIYLPWYYIWQFSSLVDLICKTEDQDYLIGRLVYLINNLSNSYHLSTIIGKNLPICVNRENVKQRRFSDAQLLLLNAIYANPFVWINSSNSISNTLQSLALPIIRREWISLLEISESQPYSPEIVEEVINNIVANRFGYGGSEDVSNKDFLKLYNLNLENIFTSNFIPYLNKFKNLTSLNLSYSDISKVSSDNLSAFSELREMQLVGNDLNEGVVEFILLNLKLKILNLSHTNVNRKWLLKLGALDNLRSLAIMHTDIPNEVISEFKDKLPNCKIIV